MFRRFYHCGYHLEVFITNFVQWWKSRRRHPDLQIYAFIYPSLHPQPPSLTCILSTTVTTVVKWKSRRILGHISAASKCFGINCPWLFLQALIRPIIFINFLLARTPVCVGWYALVFIFEQDAICDSKSFRRHFDSNDGDDAKGSVGADVLLVALLIWPKVFSLFSFYRPKK